MRLAARSSLVAALLAACSATEPRITGGDWTYAVAIAEGGERVEVEATIPAGDELVVTVANVAREFVELVPLGAGDPAQQADGTWRFAASDTQRSARWRFRAHDAARAIDDGSVAAWRGQGFVGSLATFLPFDGDGAHGSSARITVDTAQDSAFVCGWTRDGDAWTSPAEDVARRAICAFGRITVERVEPLESGALEILVARMDARGAGDEGERRDWVTRSARAVAEFLGGPGVENVLLVLTPGERSGLAGGHAEGNGLGGAAIWIAVGARTSAKQYREDWMLTHEMMHLAMPSLARRHHWLEEGSATYLEPIVRARAGIVREDDVWAEWLREYAQGLPTDSDRGLDLDSSWGRTYYGGAIFCLMADAEIRARTDGRHSLRDAFAAFVAEGGQIAVQWPIERLLEVADRATETTVVSDLYRSQSATPQPRELEPIWQRLGVRREGRRVRYDERAPWAAARRDMVLGSPAEREIRGEAGPTAPRSP